MELTAESYLFAPELLVSLLNNDGKKWNKYFQQLHAKNLTMRPLDITDFGRGYMELLGQHTRAGVVTEEVFQKQFKRMQTLDGVYFIVVIHDNETGKIIATGTLEVEHKFIHSAALRGRLEDVVVDQEASNPQYRYSSDNLAAVLLDVLTTLGKQMGCYKISLESEDHLLDFYHQFGFKAIADQHYMVVRYRD